MALSILLAIGPDVWYDDVNEIVSSIGCNGVACFVGI